MPNMTVVMSIINFLKDEVQRETNADTKESLEVAVQCLQTAYDIDPRNPVSEHVLPMSLEEIFNSALPPTEEEVDDKGNAKEILNKAEIMKNLGNNLMRSNQYPEAVRYYTAAIEIDGNNAVYYCNRAAAYSKLNEFRCAIYDCEKAVEIDPKYAKAYGRMGLAYTSLGKPDLAIKAFKQALEIEPNNESYQSNLKIALEKEKPSSPSAGAAGLSMVDWTSLFSNPAFRNMASSIMQDPNIINAFSAGMSQVVTGGNAGNTENNPTQPQASAPDGNRSLEMLLEAGQYLAAQMHAANPDLVEQFRQTPRSTNLDNQENPDADK